jgi:hypothetical protein
MQRADPGLPQQGAVVAQKRAGRRIGIDDQVGIGVQQQRRFNGKIEGDGAQIELARGCCEALIQRGKLRKIVT